MPAVRLLVVPFLLALVLALVPGPAMAAGTNPITVKIFGDYALDHEINGSYSAKDLQAAIAAAEGDQAFKEFQAAVEDVYDREFLGLHTGRGDPQTAQQPDSPSSLLPQPGGPGERNQPPWPFLAMTFIGALLVVTGAGSSIYRRVHR